MMRTWGAIGALIFIHPSQFDIFSFDRVLVPILDKREQHWLLLVIEVQKREIFVLDSASPFLSGKRELYRVSVFGWHIGL